ncbi:MAG: hypothetical protein H7235_07830 [Bdellovibrionaceae bacterium]|nr:hypothetical protein [Pseudobdellovibrionaceae bacterium]
MDMVCLSGMNNSLRSEWSILIQSFVENDSVEVRADKNHGLIGQLKTQGLTFHDLKVYAKHLSDERKSINNQIEDIKNSIDNKYQTMENLILVKSDTSDVLAQIEELNNLGELLSKKMSQIERKSKSLRLAESLF